MQQVDEMQSKIQPHMPVVCSNNGQFATVDHVDKGNSIKLTKEIGRASCRERV